MMHWKEGVRLAFWSCVVAAALLISSDAFCHERSPEEARLTEKVGSVIPAGLIFRDETGKVGDLREMVDKPTLLAVVYYGCTRICPQFLAGISAVVGDLDLAPGKDYRVITVSFDEGDTPETAGSAKKNYTKAANRPIPEDAWRFLTGDRANAEKLCDAVGIEVKRADHGFVHPEVLIVLAPGGKITRYLQISTHDYGVSYPVRFSALDVATAISWAAQGRTSTAGQTPPIFCALNQPKGQAAFFSLMKIVGLVTLIMIVSLFIYLRRQEQLRRKRIDDGR
jgi:protein SCO1/2